MTDKEKIKKLISALEGVADFEQTEEGSFGHVVCRFCRCCCDKHGPKSSRGTCGSPDSHSADCPTGVAQNLLEDLKREHEEALVVGREVIVNVGAWAGTKGEIIRVIEANGARRVELQDGLRVAFFPPELDLV